MNEREPKHEKYSNNWSNNIDWPITFSWEENTKIVFLDCEFTTFKKEFEFQNRDFSGWHMAHGAYREQTKLSERMRWNDAQLNLSIKIFFKLCGRAFFHLYCRYIHKRNGQLNFDGFLLANQPILIRCLMFKWLRVGPRWPLHILATAYNSIKVQCGETRIVYHVHVGELSKLER